MVGTNHIVYIFCFNVIVGLILFKYIHTQMAKNKLDDAYFVTKKRLTKSTRDFVKYMNGNGRFNAGLLTLHIRYVEQTNLKKYIKGLSIKWLIAGELVFYILATILISLRAHTIGIGISLGLVVAFIPIAVLDALRQYNMQRMRGDIMHMFSLLGQWYTVTEDIMKSFEKVKDHQLSEPLRSYVEEFVTQTHCGLDISEGLEVLNRKVESDFFNVFIVNIEQSISNRGEVGIMLKNLEDEAYRLQEEFNRRNISMYHDKIIIYVTMFMVLVIGYQFLVINKVTEAFYFQTVIGQTLILFYCLLYVLGFVIATGISRLEY